MALMDDYLSCAEITRANSKTFYAAFGALPEAKRNAVFAVYAYCRRCDDAVDSPDPAFPLSAVEASLESMLSSDDSADPVFRALADSFRRFSLDPLPFRDMLEGQRGDQSFRQPADQAGLERYCYLVAGTVGLMILPILATKKAAGLRQAAIDLGQAMQITNILRDVGEDLDAGRIYLPADLMDRHGLARETLTAMKISGRIDASFIAAWEELAARAERLYEGFLPRLVDFDPDSRLAVCSAVFGYRAILDTVRGAGHDCLTSRRFVKDPRPLLERAAAFVASLEARS